MHVKKFFMALVVLSLVLGAAAMPLAPARAAATCTQYHTVVRGETLFSIGVAFGVNWPQLAKINNLANPGKIYAGQKLCVSTTKSGTGGATTPVSGVIPTFSITSVVKDKTVTIQTYNFPAHDTFNLTMVAFGTRGVGGTLVQTVNSKKGGSLTFTFNIPAALAGSRRIAIRLESPTSGFFAYNWFFNNASGTGTGGGSSGGAYSGFPTFSIASVVRNTSVTISGNNFPIGDTFNVLMGAMGTRGVGGINVGTYKPTSANFSATFNVPAALQGSKQIAIRLQSPTSGFFAFNWFYNSTAP